MQSLYDYIDKSAQRHSQMMVKVPSPYGNKQNKGIWRIKKVHLPSKEIFKTDPPTPPKKSSVVNIPDLSAICLALR